jgi:hypothetical protein
MAGGHEKDNVLTLKVLYLCEPFYNHNKNTMKKTIFLFSTIMLIIMGISACKKGPNDPTFSIYSRKARVVGEWKLTAGSETQTNSGSTVITSDDGENQTVNAGSTPYIDAHTLSFTFERKGNYKSMEHRVHTDVTTAGTTTLTVTTTTDDTHTGNWNFTGKIGEYKNKSQLALNELTYATAQSVRSLLKSGSTVLSDTTTNSSNSVSYTGNPGGAEIWDLDELRSKKMVAKIKYTKVDASGGSSSRDATWTFEQ